MATYHAVYRILATGEIVGLLGRQTAQEARAALESNPEYSASSADAGIFKLDDDGTVIPYDVDIHAADLGWAICYETVDTPQPEPQPEPEYRECEDCGEWFDAAGTEPYHDNQTAIDFTLCSQCAADWQEADEFHAEQLRRWEDSQPQETPSAMRPGVWIECPHYGTNLFSTVDRADCRMCGGLGMIHTANAEMRLLFAIFGESLPVAAIPAASVAHGFTDWTCSHGLPVDYESGCPSCDAEYQPEHDAESAEFAAWFQETYGESPDDAIAREHAAMELELAAPIPLPATFETACHVSDCGAKPNYRTPAGNVYCWQHVPSYTPVSRLEWSPIGEYQGGFGDIYRVEYREGGYRLRNLTAGQREGSFITAEDVQREVWNGWFTPFYR